MRPSGADVPAVLPDTLITINGNELVAGKVLRQPVTMPEGSPLALQLDVFPRRIRNQNDLWLLTVVLRNTSQSGRGREPREAALYQTYFEVVAERGQLEKYPESQRPFDQLDSEEQSLSLLYRESATWGIGHGCAAGWDTEPGQSPTLLYADVMPAVQTPSMTPDIRNADGEPIQLSMRALAASARRRTNRRVADADQRGRGVRQLDSSEARRAERPARRISEPSPTAILLAATACLDRINGGIEILRTDDRARERRFGWQIWRCSSSRSERSSSPDVRLQWNQADRGHQLRREITTLRGTSIRRIVRTTGPRLLARVPDRVSS